MNSELNAESKYAASGNRNVDPLLISTTHGPENSKALRAGSPAISAGLDLDYLGSGFNLGLNPSSNFLSQPPNIITADQNSHENWEIGPYVYTGGTVNPPSAPAGLSVR